MLDLVVPLSDVDYYERLVESGADEFYVGFLPMAWLEKYGISKPINRREYMFGNSNICSYAAMEILAQYVKYYGKKIKIALNSHFYEGEQYEYIMDYIEKLSNLGFDEFIIADPCLLHLLKKYNINCKIHLSGEMETLNHYTIEFFHKNNIKRIVFPRKISLEDMSCCIANETNVYEYEAFVLNALCSYSGGFCNSIHCDEMPATCGILKTIKMFNENDNEYSVDVERANRKIVNDALKKMIINDSKVQRTHVFGASGCGICSIKSLEEIGITHLKIVGRGYSIDKLVHDVKTLKEIIKLSYGTSQLTFQTLVQNKYLYNKCSKCYYHI